MDVPSMILGAAVASVAWILLVPSGRPQAPPERDPADRTQA